jgi:hypothetical protein
MINGKPLRVDLVKDNTAYTVVMKNTISENAKRVFGEQDYWIEQIKLKTKDAHISLV